MRSTSSREIVMLAAVCVLAACVVQRRPVAHAPRAAVPSAQRAHAAAVLERLPSSVRPIRYSLELTIDPKAERFHGRVQIAVELLAPQTEIFLHGRGLSVSRVVAHLSTTRIAGSYAQENADGLARLRFERALPAGAVLLELVYDAPFDRQLKGLYRVDAEGRAYAFTQFEPISARSAFPCFDEPGFKTPFETWLSVPAELVAASNSLPVAEERFGAMKRVRFAQTKPLPTYLVAFAVGAFDVVEHAPIAPTPARATPLPLRALAIKGRGALLAHALAAAGAQLVALERYFGTPYPYDKLDLVAVPDFGAGAMENAGLITFRDWLLLVDPKSAGQHQLRASGYVLAHELAHQWFGNLVTMQYWDDLWLNEAFATWLGYRLVYELHPEHSAELTFLSAVHAAMDADSRKSARMIRQPIESTHDILNAFDGITYNKGGAVLAMFERYLGAEVFRSGVQRYLAAHAFGNATTKDFLNAMSASAGSDVNTPFATFLTQSGVPIVKATLRCAGEAPEVLLEQSRYLPLGSQGDAHATWQVPVCLRHASQGAAPRTTCTLMTSASATLPLQGACPAWLQPNADAAGYYRFALPPAELEQLRAPSAWRALSQRERVATASALQAGYDSGAIDAATFVVALPALAADDSRMVATLPMAFLRRVRTDVLTQAEWPALEAYTRKLYAPALARLGFAPRASDAGDDKLLRGQVLELLADVGNDPAVRAKLVAMGQRYLGVESKRVGAVPSDLAELAVRLFAEQGDDATFAALYARMTSTDDVVLRARILRALGSVRDARSDKALALVLDPALRVNEVLVPLRDQLSDARTRDRAWQWFEEHFAELAARLSSNFVGGTPGLAMAFCSDAMAERVQRFFEPKIATLTGGPRSLATAVEELGLCAASLRTHGAGLRAAFAAPRAQ
jgi:cytosol alanyl aminopeptidase